MVKVTSLSNEPYKKLSEIKNKKDIIKFAGIFAKDKNWEKIMGEIEKDRKNIKLEDKTSICV